MIGSHTICPQVTCSPVFDFQLTTINSLRLYCKSSIHVLRRLPIILFRNSSRTIYATDVSHRPAPLHVLMRFNLAMITMSVFYIYPSARDDIGSFTLRFLTRSVKYSAPRQAFLCPVVSASRSPTRTRHLGAVSSVRLWFLGLFRHSLHAKSLAKHIGYGYHTLLDSESPQIFYNINNCGFLHIFCLHPLVMNWSIITNSWPMDSSKIYLKSFNHQHNISVCFHHFLYELFGIYSIICTLEAWILTAEFYNIWINSKAVISNLIWQIPQETGAFCEWVVFRWWNDL